MSNYTKEEQKAHRKLWIEALRSDNYKQIDGRLKKDDGYCCLGVACDISGQGEFNGDGAFKSINGYQSYTNLTFNVQDWLGLNTDSGLHYDDASHIISLITLNDIKGYTFEQIAAIIEREPEGLVYA